MEGQQQQPLRKPTNDKHMNIPTKNKNLKMATEGVIWLLLTMMKRRES